MEESIIYGMRPVMEAIHSGKTIDKVILQKGLGGPLFKDLFMEPNPIPGKAAMAILGAMENSLRLPLVPALPGTIARMEEILKSLQLC